MVKRTKLADVVVEAQADALAKLCAGGFIDIYDGEQPESDEAPITKQKLCVSLEFGSPAFAPAVKGILSANPIKSGVAVADVNPATWARIYKSDHRTRLMDVSVGKKDANIILPTTHIVRGVTVSCSSFTHSVAKATAGV